MNDILQAKLKYKEKLEQEFSTMNTKEAFQKVRTLTGYDSKPMPSAITDPLSFAEDLNIFYARFDTTNCSEECKALLETLPIPEPAHPAPFTVEDVRRQLSRCKPGAAPRNFARLLFIDFSSAFNNIQRHQMIQKLHHFDVPPLLIH
ncbi:hypothetical protein SKAU_G00194950 [Synaphobranchus kaupii]|uniref:Reverse transcriptase domain-containing protein n=1 Tax=Synaphobranchus kaupii TaxID=118154 RepID=A0A9Q1FE87_SYNKA|nr:hypothetical protein SKAU_G00194950 [Synaphobranchus kaupii]